MDKLACLKFVIQSDGIDDAVKVAAAVDYIKSHDSDEEKLASFHEMEDLYKEAVWWGALAKKVAPWLMRTGQKLAPAGAKGLRGSLGSWMNRVGAKGFKNAWAPASKALGGGAKASGATQSISQMMAAPVKNTASAAAKAAAQGAGATGAKSTGALSRFFGWGAKHPGLATGLVGGTAVGAGLGAGALYGGMRENDAYKRGYGTATSQVGPMLAATMGRRGAMGMPQVG